MLSTEYHSISATHSTALDFEGRPTLCSMIEHHPELNPHLGDETPPIFSIYSLLKAAEESSI